jgi:predicted nuclease of predicted toxin-antitoxin system
MRIKLDENLPAELAKLLSDHGHDVHTVPGESLAGHPDRQIFAAAMTEKRVLFTQDLDFADLRKFTPGAHPGVVLIRLRDPSRQRLTERIKHILRLESVERWTGCFVVISDRKLRIKRP